MVTDPGHTLANGDQFIVDAVTSQGLLVRWVLEDERLAERPVLYPRDKLGVTDLGYAVTGHTGQGGTVQRGEAVFRGGEPREWAYVALTRGQEHNTARVITQAQAADPRAGTQAGTCATANMPKPGGRRRTSAGCYAASAGAPRTPASKRSAPPPRPRPRPSR